MADTLPLAILCGPCQQIFEGHWAPKETLETASPATQIGELDIPSGDGLVDNISSPEDTDLSSEDDIYENPDWVKVVATDRDNSSLKVTSSLSPRHLSILGLEESALNGCHLCTIIWDIVSNKVDELEAPVKEDLSRPIGVIIVRPYDDTAGRESLVLEISYFIDGKVAQDAYVFTMDVLLVDPQGLWDSPQYPRLVQGCDGSCPLRSLQQIKNWISECFTEHQECQKQTLQGQDVSGLRRLPTRLLRVEPTEGHPRVSLCEAQSLEASTPYTTLSHCWGGTPIIRLLSELYVKFTQEIAFGDLPKAFQDAVTFTSALGIKFIWIDSLCIIQDSEDDWLREALLMSSVYSNSWVNFAATSSKDGRGGLFLPNNPLLSRPCLVNASWTGLEAGVYLCLDENAWERRVENGPLNKRAWVLQERLLAPRTVHCAYDQLWWSCADTRSSCSEAFPNGVPMQMSHSTGGLMAALSLSGGNDLTLSNESWLGIVKDYTKATLTYNSDKLVALAGIAEAATQIMGFPRDSYLAGLWKFDLRVDLLWRMVGSGSRPATYRAPSWSWASVDGEVFFHSADKRDVARKNLVATVLEAHITPASDPLGPVKGGHLTLQGPLLKINLSGPDTSLPGDTSLRKLRIGTTTFSSGTGFEEVLDHEPLYSEWPTGGKTLCFACFMTTPDPQIGNELESAGLVVERTGDGPGVYRRVGWLRVFHESPAGALFADAARLDPLGVHEYLQYGGGDIYSYRII